MIQTNDDIVVLYTLAGFCNLRTSYLLKFMFVCFVKSLKQDVRVWVAKFIICFAFNKVF